MKTSERILASHGAGVVTIQGKGAGYLMLQGTSVPCMAEPGDMASVLNFAPDKPGFVAIRWVAWDKSHESYDWLVPIEKKNDHFEANLESVWIPDPDRLGHVGYGEVSVMYRNPRGRESYFSNVEKEGAFLVDDVNLLCRFLAGDASYKELLSKARQPLAQKNFARLYEGAKTELEQCKADLNKTRHLHDASQNAVDKWSKYAMALKVLAGVPWFKRRVRKTWLAEVAKLDPLMSDISI